jgi:hypothetical protein
MEFIKEYYMWAVYAVIFIYCVWNGFKIEFSVGNHIYFSYEIYELKRIMRYF